MRGAGYVRLRISWWKPAVCFLTAPVTKPATFLALLLPLTAAAISVVAAGSRLAAPDTEVSVIVAKALERANWAQEQDVGARFRYSMTQRIRQFDGDGDVTEDETRGYTVEPYEGTPYAKLVTQNGEPIAGDELEDEAERWQAFLDALEDPPDDDTEEEADSITVLFNAELLDRYTAELVGIRDVRGRPAYVLEFEPRPGKLPVRRRIDHALNKCRGEIWIDQDTYEIARVNFELMDRVRLWWGILGSVSDATGHFERMSVADNAWLASEIDLYFHVRALFSTSRRSQTTRWEAFEPIAD